ncbi:MAG: 4-hydroxy-tetrahydrodipicolinate synthase [Methanomassiliicoccales archaeon]|nr:4-hydroxy-tetrahydrodipicolinate synthase [Methanomassiliicoccales archaeon]MDD1755656.1 4-hydroxy-tetrahydrodipicolinate synthase [Methanomassiliicoccales archaeon]
MIHLQGTGTAIVTPFKEGGEVDEEGLRSLVTFQEENGVDFIVPVGTTGESATLSHTEHLKVIKIVVDQAKRAKVVAGAGSNSTSEAIHLSKGARDLGVSAILSISPYYNKPTQKGLIKHYEAITKAVDAPFIVYNVPGRTGSNINPSTVLKLAENPNIIGVKEASGNMSQIMAILERAPKGFSVVSGDDALTFPIMALGGRGVISVASNVAPSQVSSMVRDALDGRWEESRKQHFRLLPLFTNLFLETNPIPVKTALRMMGMPAGVFRLPLCEMEPSNQEVLRKTLADLGLLK